MLKVKKKIFAIANFVNATVATGPEKPEKNPDFSAKPEKTLKNVYFW